MHDLNLIWPKHGFAFKSGGGGSASQPTPTAAPTVATPPPEAVVTPPPAPTTTPPGPVYAPPAPGYSTTSAEVTQAKLDAKRQAARRKGINSTILAGADLTGTGAGGSGAKTNLLGGG